MPDTLLIPSVDLRIGALEEYNRQQKNRAGRPKTEQPLRPCITISREYGCEAYPVSELLCALMKQRTGEKWMLMDNALFVELARNHNLSEDILRNLGTQNRYLTEFLATFSSRWGSHEDHFRQLSRYIISLADSGNVIIVGQGSAVVTQHLKNCCHFRLYASLPFKVASISRRLNIPSDEAEELIHKRQKQRDRFNSEFLDQHKHDLHYYDLVFNNDRASNDIIATSIADYVTAVRELRM